MNFIDTLDNSPTDLIGSKYGVVVFAAKDFDDWCESLAIAHDDEVYIASNAYLEDTPDERLTKNGLVRLPVDADGVPIHIGDVMEWCDSGETLTVEGIGRDVLFYVDGENAEWTAARNKRHHHEPTVEDVLREFTDEMNQNLGMYTCEAIDADEWRDADAKTVEKFAAKLRLAGENA